MTERADASALSTATDVPPAHTAAATDLKGATDAAKRAARLLRQLVGLNLGFVALQAITAGLSMSGYGRAVTIHRGVGLALQLVALVQIAAACVLWRRRCVPAWVAGVSIALFAIVFVQNGLGYNRQYWLHVPIGVGMFGGLIRQTSKLDALSRATGARS